MSTVLIGDPSDVAVQIQHAESQARDADFIAGIQDDVRARIARGQPFAEMPVDLSDPTELKWSGGVVYGIVYRRQGSTAGGRLDVTLGGGTFRALYPGARLEGLFPEVTIKRSSSSATAGSATIILLLRRGVDFVEPAADPA